MNRKIRLMLNRAERRIGWAWFYLSARRVKRVAQENDIIISRFGKLYFVEMVTKNGAVRIRDKYGKFDYIMPKYYRVLEER